MGYDVRKEHCIDICGDLCANDDCICNCHIISGAYDTLGKIHGICADIMDTTGYSEEAFLTIYNKCSSMLEFIDKWRGV